MRYLLLCLVTACDPASAKPVPDQTSSTGVFDFDLVHRSTGGFVINDPAYEVTLPTKPSFKAVDMSTPTGSRISGMTAAATLDGGGDTIVFSVTVMPGDLKIDSTAVGELAADYIHRAGAKLTTDTEATLGGLPAHKVVAAGTYAGKPFQIVEYFALDTKHHTVVGIIDVSAKKPDPAFEAVRTSFTVKAGPAPHARAAK